MSDPITITFTVGDLLLLLTAWLASNMVGIFFRAFWRAFWPKVRDEYRWRKRAREVRMSGNESGRHQ